MLARCPTLLCFFPCIRAFFTQKTVLQADCQQPLQLHPHPLRQREINQHGGGQGEDGESGQCGHHPAPFFKAAPVEAAGGVEEAGQGEQQPGDCPAPIRAEHGN